MKAPDKSIKIQGIVALNFRCQEKRVSVRVTVPTFCDGDQIEDVDLTAQDCLRLADMLRESATYLLRNKHEEKK